MTASAELKALVSAGRFRDALAHYQSGAALVPVPSADDCLLAATAAGHLGQLDLGVSLAAEAHLQCRVSANATGLIRSAHLLGGFAFERGRLGDAEAYFAEAIRLAEREGDDLQAARASNNLASVAHLGGRTQDAIRLYDRALAAYRRNGDDVGAAETSHNLSLVLRDQGRLREAGAVAETAVAHARAGTDAGLLALVLAGRAELALAAGDTDAAMVDLDEARPLALKGADLPALAELDRLVALVALARGDAEAAYESALHAWGAAGLEGHALLEAECAAACALALKALGRVSEGQGFFLEAERRLVTLGNASRARRLAREWASG
jgi:tetratricopeptide (TPR) repeat protein